MWKARIKIPNHTQKRSGGLRKYPVACNKCRKPFKGSLFFCKCNCLFCEGVFPLQWCLLFKYLLLLLTFLFNAASFIDCAYSHFSKNKNCPSCKRTLGNDDFKELMVLQPPPFKKLKTSIYKQVFVKTSRKARYLNGGHVWNQIWRQHSMCRQGLRFAMRQLMKDNKAQNKRAFNIHRTLKAMKGNQNLVKGESTQLKTALEGYKQQLVVAKQKIDEKDRQLAQFRKMVESRSSSSSHSDNSQRKYLSGGEISGGGQRSSVSQRPRPRRVSDEHVPPPSAHSNSSHTYGYNPRGQPENRQKKLNAHVRDQINPYQQQLGSRHGSQKPSNGHARYPVNPYEQQLDSKQPPTTKPSTRPPPQHPSNHHSHTQHSYPNTTQHSRGNASSSVASSSTTSGGDIRKITAATGFSFSGAAGKRRKPSPSEAYASNNNKNPRGYRPQSY